MASSRNNRIQERRAVLRDHHKREREAADAAFKALDDEHAARVAAARAVSSVVELSGRERTAMLLGLEPRDVTAYERFAKDAVSEDANTDTGDQGAADSTTGADKSTAADIPSQGERAQAAGAASA